MSKKDARHYHTYCTYIYPTRYIDLTRQQPSCTIPSYRATIGTYLDCKKKYFRKKLSFCAFFLSFLSYNKYLSKKKSPLAIFFLSVLFVSAFSDAACFPSVFNYFCTFRTIA